MPCVSSCVSAIADAWAARSPPPAPSLKSGKSTMLLKVVASAEVIVDAISWHTAEGEVTNRKEALPALVLLWFCGVLRPNACTVVSRVCDRPSMHEKQDRRDAKIVTRNAT